MTISPSLSGKSNILITINRALEWGAMKKELKGLLGQIKKEA